MNKKGSVQDVLFAIAAVFALGVFALLMFYIGNEIADGFVANEQFNNSSAAVAGIQGTYTVSSMTDYLVAATFFGFILAIIITGFLIEAHSIFFLIYMFAMAVIILIGGILAYTWEQIAATTLLAGSLVAMPITNHILSNLGMYTALIGAIGVFVLYMKNRGFGE